MSTYTTHPVRIKYLTDILTERYRKQSSIAKLIGKSTQTVRQYRADLRSKSSRLMPANDMVKLLIDIENRRAADDDRRVHDWDISEVKTGAKLYPAFMKRPEGTVASIYRAYDPDGVLLTETVQRGIALREADLKLGYVKMFIPVEQERPYALTKVESLRSRYRRLVVSGRAEMWRIKEVFGCDEYDLICFWSEKLMAAMPPEEHILLLEDEASFYEKGRAA